MAETNERGGAPSALEQQARKFVGTRGIPGDAYNNFMSLQVTLGDIEQTAALEPLQTYEEYFRERKFVENAAMAEEVIRRTNPELLAEYNALVKRINEEIAVGLATDVQISKVRALLSEQKALFMEQTCDSRERPSCELPSLLPPLSLSFAMQFHRSWSSEGRGRACSVTTRRDIPRQRKRPRQLAS